MQLVIAIVIEIFITYILRINTEIETIDGIIFVLINLTIFMFWCVLNKKMTKTQRILMITGYILRTILLIVDRYITTLPYNNSDADGFNDVAVRISNDLTLLRENLYGGVFTKILGILYYFLGENRMFAQSLNSLISMGCIYNIFIILNNIKLKENFKNNFLQVLLVFLPQTLLISVVLLREILVIYFITVSLKYCFQYTKSGKKISAIISIVSIIVASTFHAGALFLIIGYILLFSFYSVKEKKIVISTKKISVFVVLVAILGIVYMRYGNVIATKLTILDEERLANSFEGESKGGSAYLGGKEINGFTDMLIYTIPKTIYFMLSPMPWNWRGISDMTSFAIDSLIYLYLIYEIIKNRKKVNMEYKSIINLLLIGMTVTIVAFAVGTSNAGTAIRHRHKLFGYILTMAVVCINENKTIKEE